MSLPDRSGMEPRGETYDLGDGRTLYVFTVGDGDEMWACAMHDHGPFCRMCQRVDGALWALLENVFDGNMTCRQDPQTGEFEFKMTEHGFNVVGRMIENITDAETDDS